MSANDEILAVAKRYGDLAREASVARTALQKIGVTPGLGLDVWSQNIIEYAHRVANQLGELQKAKKAGLASNAGDFVRFSCGCGTIGYANATDLSRLCDDCKNGAKR